VVGGDAAIGFTTRMWLSAIIVLVGADLNSGIEWQAVLKVAPHKAWN
jgi:hypothetical protein